MSITIQYDSLTKITIESYGGASWEQDVAHDLEGVEESALNITELIEYHEKGADLEDFRNDTNSLIEELQLMIDAALDLPSSRQDEIPGVIEAMRCLLHDNHITI